MATDLRLPDHLDEEAQRGLVLRAARELALRDLDLFYRVQPTFAELERAIDANLADVPLLAGAAWIARAPALRAVDRKDLERLREHVARSWREWLARPDPETAHWVLEGDVRRLILALPAAESRGKRRLLQAVDALCRAWAAHRSEAGAGTGPKSARAGVREALLRAREALRSGADAETTLSLLRGALPS